MRDAMMSWQGLQRIRRCISVGECMVEVAPNPSGAYTLGFAGDTFNTAWYLAARKASGLEVCFASAIGSDAASQRLQAFVEGCGITPAFQVVTGGSVGLYLIQTDNGERSFSYWRGEAAARRLAEDTSKLPAVVSTDLVFFSGITLAILLDQGRQNFLEYLKSAREVGACVVFDPNLRPGLWEDQATMCDWITEAAKVSDIVLPSFEDEGAHFGDVGPEDTGRRYLRQGAELVVVKNGPDAVTVMSPLDTRHVDPTPAAKVVDTTAAGDSFNAGLLSSLIAGNAVEKAVADGCALSAAVIQGAGALVPVE